MPEEVTKQSFRLKVWRHLETNGLAMFPRPVYNRIPNFKGATEAAAKLADLDIFKAANTIKVNPDKPQEPVRSVFSIFIVALAEPHGFTYGIFFLYIFSNLAVRAP